MSETERELRKRAISEIRKRLDSAEHLYSRCDPHIINEISKADILIEKYKHFAGGGEWEILESDSKFIKDRFIKECVCSMRKM